MACYEDSLTFILKEESGRGRGGEGGSGRRRRRGGEQQI
jgi:hypothetical protein